MNNNDNNLFGGSDKHLIVSIFQQLEPDICGTHSNTYKVASM